MIHSTYAIENIDLVCSLLRCLCPGNGCLSTRLTSHDTCTFTETVYLDLVDLDYSITNNIVVEKGQVPEVVSVVACSRLVVDKIVNIVNNRLGEGHDDNSGVLERIRIVEEKMEKISAV